MPHLKPALLLRKDSSYSIFSDIGSNRGGCDHQRKKENFWLQWSARLIAVPNLRRGIGVGIGGANLQPPAHSQPSAPWSVPW